MICIVYDDNKVVFLNLNDAFPNYSTNLMLIIRWKTSIKIDTWLNSVSCQEKSYIVSFARTLGVMNVMSKKLEIWFL